MGYRLETFLPLGKVDPGLRVSGTALNIGSVATDAALVEALGYFGLAIEETKDDPYVIAALAAQATTRLHISTAVAMAFPRSPTVTALSAWTLQKLSSGRFTLGLGPQVKGHITRRYGLEWSPAGPWMRDYVSAIRAVWHSWQTGEKLRFESDHYNLDLMVPLFDPGPVEQPDIPIHLAAVNPYMCQIAGEVADGIRPHPVCTPNYIREIMVPAVEKGIVKAKRDGHAMSLCVKPLIATAPDEDRLQPVIEDIRARVSFYASTPAYRTAFEFHGYGELATELATLSKAQRWEEMPRLIDDKALNIYATVGIYDEIAGRLQARYENLATTMEFSIPVTGDKDRETLRALVTELKNES